MPFTMLQSWKNISNDLSRKESFRSKEGKQLVMNFMQTGKKTQKMREKKKTPKFMLISLQMVGVFF